MNRLFHRLQAVQVFTAALAAVHALSYYLSAPAHSQPGSAPSRLQDIPQALRTLRLDYLPTLKQLPLSAIPGLSEFRIADVPNLARLPVQRIAGLEALACPGCTLAEAITRGLLSGVSLDSPIAAVAGLTQVRLGSIPDLGGLPLEAIPNLGQLSLAGLDFGCLAVQLTDHVNSERGGFTEFATVNGMERFQRFKVGQTVTCNQPGAKPMRIRHVEVNEVGAYGKFEMFQLVCSPFCNWVGPIPWMQAFESENWLGPQGGIPTLDTP